MQRPIFVDISMGYPPACVPPPPLRYTFHFSTLGEQMLIIVEIRFVVGAMSLARFLSGACRCGRQDVGYTFFGECRLS